MSITIKICEFDPQQMLVLLSTITCDKVNIQKVSDYFSLVLQIPPHTAMIYLNIVDIYIKHIILIIYPMIYTEIYSWCHFELYRMNTF